MSRSQFAIACGISLAIVAGCEAPANALNPGQVLNRDRVIGEPGPIPAGGDYGPSGSAGAPIGDSCHSEDPQKICLGIKYVVYRDATGEPVVSQQAAINNVRSINNVFNQCGIAFQIDQYLPARPSDFELRYQIANYSELEDIRDAFNENNTMLIVTTGTWDRTGSLGNATANAWTSMPGGGPYGAVLERPVGTFANIIAHELGHYLNLLHVSDTTDLMNPIIYSNSTKLTATQCRTARNAAAFFWAKMYR